MGASAASDFLEILRGYDALTAASVSRFVLTSLYEGREARVGTARYADLERGLYEQIGTHENRDGEEQTLSVEAADYLQAILSTALGDRRSSLPPYFVSYDGFSRQAYEEVYELLGPAGRNYLGISGLGRTLRPSDWARWSVIEEEYAPMDVASEQDDARDTPRYDPLPDLPADTLPELPYDPLPGMPDMELPGWPDYSPAMPASQGGYQTNSMDAVYD